MARTWRDEDGEPLRDEQPWDECRYCGAWFQGTGGDCGGCRLDDEQARQYAARVVAR